MADRSDAALALSVAALVPSIYSLSLPTLTDTRGQADDRGHIAAGEKYAACVAGAVVLGVAGVTRSATAAVAGLVAVVGLSAAYRFANRAQP